MSAAAAVWGGCGRSGFLACFGPGACLTAGACGGGGGIGVSPLIGAENCPRSRSASLRTAAADLSSDANLSSGSAGLTLGENRTSALPDLTSGEADLNSMMGSVSGTTGNCEIHAGISSGGGATGPAFTGGFCPD
jgi:hypothetical protein